MYHHGIEYEHVGKTTVFNLLTGLSQHVGNWPGKTVERKEGTFSRNATRLRIVDLPGTYSLTAYSVEERVVRGYLIEEKPDVVIHVVDSGNLARNLYLTVQLLELEVDLALLAGLAALGYDAHAVEPDARVHAETDSNDAIYGKCTHNTQVDYIGVRGNSEPSDYYGLGGDFEGDWIGVEGFVLPTSNHYYYGGYYYQRHKYYYAEPEALEPAPTWLSKWQGTLDAIRGRALQRSANRRRVPGDKADKGPA